MRRAILTLVVALLTVLWIEPPAAVAESVPLKGVITWGTTHTDPAMPLRFPGQYHDPETGLHYNLHRYYDPHTGRYLTQDPLGLTPSPNPTTYPANPTTHTDPLGLQTCDTTKTAPTFIGSTDGVVVTTSRSRLISSFESAGFQKTPTSSPGMHYTLPDGSVVRVMEPAGQAPLRASFTNANGGPVSPFTGKPVQPPPGLTKAERTDIIRARTHVELGP